MRIMRKKIVRMAKFVTTTAAALVPGATVVVATI
jgi:hypothetical protein